MRRIPRRAIANSVIPSPTMIRTHAITLRTGPICDIDAADVQSTYVKVPQRKKTAYSRNTESGVSRPLFR